MKLSGRGQSDVGQIRSSNQDSFLIAEDEKLFIVADGMGGHAGGEIASQLCIDRVQNYLQKNPFVDNAETQDKEITAVLADSINHASAKIYEYSLENPSLRGMGTTATVLKFHKKKAFYAHVGDSRLYLIRRGFLYQITFDHSLVNEQLRAGLITPEEAEIHHLKNVITRSVGYQEEEEVDTDCFEVENDDYFVLCSDGLYGKIPNAEISNTVQRLGLDSVTTLIEMANQRGGEDNITAIVVTLSEFIES